MFVLGMLCNLYSLDMDLAREQIAFIFGKKAEKVIKSNVALLEAGYAWAERQPRLRFRVPAERGRPSRRSSINGNTAIALGVLASGMDICAMYPITPATSASHYLSDVFERAGGIVHQAEDEIAACAFAIGASYAGKVRGHDHLGPGLFAEAGGHRPRGHGRDPARRRQRAARRAEHRPADQGRAGRPADRDVRQPRRRAQGRDGGEHASRTASTR